MLRSGLAAACLAALAACATQRASAPAAEPHPAAVVEAAPEPAAPAPAAEPAPAAPEPEPPSAFEAVAPAGPDEWWSGAVFYEVYLRSFADSDGDGVGDLRGLAAHLDDLRASGGADPGALGVDALWLMPVFPSPSVHGYDVTDYERIDPRYGTLDDFQALVEAAHRRGLRVVLDLPLNHTSSQHPWFQDSASGPTAAHRGWYQWSPKNPGWGQPWSFSTAAWHKRNGAFYYGLFWSEMPDLDYRNPAVRAEMERVVRLWLSRGVDGFRLDAVRFLVETGPGRGQASTPETHAYLKELSADARGARPDAALLGEVWSITEDIADYYGSGSDELQLLLDFPVAAAAVAAAKGGKVDELARVLAEVQRYYPRGAVDAPFLTNHDQPRLATQLAGDPARLRLAAALLLTLPGSPVLYQGEELGQENGPGQEDEEKRLPISWDCAPPGHGFTTGTAWHAFGPDAGRACASAERADPGSLRSWYRTLIALRRATPSLRRGSLELVKAPGAPGTVLAFLRRSGTEAVLVVHNAGPAAADTGVLRVAGERAEPLLTGEARLEREGDGWRATLPPLSSGVWRVR
jgi:alpha-amylase